MQTANSLLNLNKANTVKQCCVFCDRSVSLANLTKHQKSCKNNPDRKYKECPVCSSKYYTSGATCSYGCANTFFRSGSKNPNWKGHYRNVCFESHGKKCIVCGEDKIVAVHHLNEDHSDNRSENLVPLCPTHHQYVHSKFRHLIQPYLDKFLGVG